ncbi:patatin-like phospholipase family protein [Oxalobacteraceae sp. CFBP 8761]|nr:patatin-like phospholipase family protein [Oxalobacteraceae sp. CFBP 8761]
MDKHLTVPTECDVIMEGGVTSGVVFPSFIARLSTRFDFRCIGGTSVGAVAASATAAAQFWRNACQAQGDPAAAELGFQRLACLPEELCEPRKNGKSTLYSLFQPCPGLRRHFAILSSVLNRTSAVSRVTAGVRSTIVHCWEAPALGLLGCLLGYALGQLSLIALVLISALMIVLLAVIQFVVTGYLALCRNNFGMCPGMGSDAGEPALTQWLHGLIQAIAYQSKTHPPLTFGELANSSKSITLAFMSTGLAERRAHRLPHDSDDLLFRRSHLAQLFPADVVDHLCTHGRQTSTRKATLEALRKADPHFGTDRADVFYLPPEEQLPVVFAARLSLSFPILLQAVPLFRLRYIEGNGIDEGSVRLAPIWFSDGGLSSNFPMHFFDELLPERPAFGVALENSLAEGAPDCQRVKLPDTHAQGLVSSYLSVDNRAGKPSLLSFIIALLNTSRAWRDEALQRTPGYRDRIVRIRHTKKEGGLNLNMPHSAIEAMSKSGILAANKVIERFVGSDGKGEGWLNHRWVRARSTTAVLQDTIAPLARTWRSNAQSPSYHEMWEGAFPGQPTSYKLGPASRKAGLIFWDALEKGLDPSDIHALTETVPRPRPTLEITPKLG